MQIHLFQMTVIKTEFLVIKAQAILLVAGESLLLLASGGTNLAKTYHVQQLI